MIKKLLRVLINSILLPDREEEMEVPIKIRCRTCKNMTANLQKYSAGFVMYHCSLCKTTFGGSVEKGFEGFEVMGKKNRGKKNKGKKNNPVSIVKKTTAADDSWEVKIDCVKECSKVPDKAMIWVYPLSKRKIDALMSEYKNIEWLAYLLGDKEEREVKDIFVPDQSISTAAVDDIDCEEFNDLPVIGVIHSHHTMGTTFSHTDHNYINGNHDISLVISNTGIDGQCRLKTECGAYKIVDVEVKLKVDIDFDDKAFIESVKDKITEKTYTYASYGSYGNYGNQQWSQGYGWQPRGAQQNTGGGTKQQLEDETSFLTTQELDDIEKEIEELDFEKELSLAEELELLEETNTLDDIEAN